MASRPSIRKCFGINPKTGREVGERHRWTNGWGKGRCDYCGKFLEDLFETPPQPGVADLPLDVAIERATQRAKPTARNKPCYCLYPHCKCTGPGWCYDAPPRMTGDGGKDTTQ